MRSTWNYKSMRAAFLYVFLILFFTGCVVFPSFLLIFLTFLLFVKVFILFVGIYAHRNIKNPSIDDLKKLELNLKSNSLPMYTILVPLYMESIKSIEKIRRNIFNIKYSNFEVLYLCEENDVLALAFFQKNITS